MYNEITDIEFTSDNQSEYKVTYADGNFEYIPVKRATAQIKYWLDGKSLAYVDYENISTYDAKLSEYETLLTNYNACIESEEGDCGEEPIAPVKPEHYYTQEEVDERNAEIAQWQTEKDAFISTEDNPEFTKEKPEIIYSPDIFPVVELNMDKSPKEYKPNQIKKRKKVNAERDKAYKNLTVEYNGHTIEGHEKARQELNGTVTDIILSRMAGLPDGTVIWTTADDEDIEFTFDDIIAIARLVKSAYYQIHLDSRTKKKKK
jgi:hypothetical protein